MATLTLPVINQIREYNRLTDLADEAHGAERYAQCDEYTDQAQAALAGVTAEQFKAHNQAILQVILAAVNS